MTTCANCGAAVADHELHCPTCGQALIPERPTGTPPPGAGPFPSTPAIAGPDSRNWAVGAHVSALVGVLIGGLPAFLGPLVVWLLRRDDRFAAEHARRALNFNLSVLLYALVALLLVVVTLGLGLLVVVPVGAVAFVGYLVVTVLAAVAASRGQPYRYPLTIQFVR